MTAQPPDESAGGTRQRRLSKPAPPHNSMMGPARCMCVGCCRIVLNLRCPVVSGDGDRCGDYKAHRGSHTQLICTGFLIAEERLRLDATSGEAES